MIDLLEHHRRLDDYYGPLLRKHGSGYRGVGWVREHLQTSRFDVLSAVGDIRHASILDIGSGTGHFLDWLHERGYDGEYLGIEVQDAMVERARLLHPPDKFPNASFECGEFLEIGPAYEADFVMASGIFPLADLELLKRTVTAMFGCARTGVAFNCLSAFSPRHEPPFFFFADPVPVLAFCFSLTKALLFRHDYLPQDFTVYLYKD